MKTILTRNSKVAGSALVAVLLVVMIVTVISGAVLRGMTRNRMVMNQSAVWDEALVAAESGVHQAIAQLEQGLADNALPTGNQTFRFTLNHGGQSATAANVEYTLSRNDLFVGGMSRTYYVVNSTGTVRISGGRTISSDDRDVVLRKLDLAPGTQTATRRIQAVFRPRYNTDGALKTQGRITLNNFKIFLDSFDSNDPLRSVLKGPGTMGQFNVAPWNVMRATMTTNSDFVQAGDASVYGDAYTNGGVIGNSANIFGEIRDDYNEPFAPVYAPSWASTVSPGVQIPTGNGNSTQTVSSLNKAAVFYGGTAANPARYVLNSISLAGNNDVVTFATGLQGNTVDPTKTYVELYVKGDFTTKGGGTNSVDSGSIIISPGVNVKIIVGGNLNFSGNGLTNNNGLASSLEIKGVNAPVAPANQSFTFAGTSSFYGTVYAPGADLKLAGGGSSTSGTFVGSLVGKTAFLNGNTQIRYDEALSNGGIITGFTVASWFEDTKKDGTTFGGQL